MTKLDWEKAKIDQRTGKDEYARGNQYQVPLSQAEPRHHENSLLLQQASKRNPRSEFVKSVWIRFEESGKISDKQRAVLEKIARG